MIGIGMKVQMRIGDQNEFLVFIRFENVHLQ